jgi:peptide/nickel transport system permease protein
VSTVVTPAVVVKRRTSQRRDTILALLRSPTFMVGIVVVGFWVLCALAGEHIAPYDAQAQYDATLVGPQCHFSRYYTDINCGDYWFGTDQLGRDVASRVFTGASDVLKIAPLATLLGVVGGTILGLVSGYFGGLVDEVIGRLTDAVLALPLIVVAVTALVALGTSGATLITLIGVVFMPLVGRTVRAAVLVERDLDYVEAARLRGERAPYIMFAEILPNVAGPIVVESTVRLGYAIFAVAGLTFLGFGVQPPSSDWSLQIRDNYTLLSSGGYSWTVLFPAGAIATLVVGVNLIADGLQQVFDQ